MKFLTTTLLSLCLTFTGMAHAVDVTKAAEQAVTQKMTEKATDKVNPSQMLGKKVNLNSATLEQLQTLKGVGPKKAQAILDYRKANGKFSSVDDLLKVKGVGPQFLLDNKGLLGL